MTRWLWVAITILLVGCVDVLAAPSPSSSCLVSPGKSIGLLSLGMTRDEVIRFWGAPDRVEPLSSGDRMMMYSLLRFGAAGVDGEDRVIFLALDDEPCLVTTEGIAVGDLRSKTQNVYGRPSEASDSILSAVLARKKARLWIGTEFRDLHWDSYLGRGLTISTGQTMHVNGYASSGQPIFVPVDPEPLVYGFMVYTPRSEKPAAPAVTLRTPAHSTSERLRQDSLY
jgi:hypothetical protein